MLRSPLERARHALAATCAILLGGLALGTAAQADPPCPDGARAAA